MAECLEPFGAHRVGGRCAVWVVPGAEISLPQAPGYSAEQVKTAKEQIRSTLAGLSSIFSAWPSRQGSGSV